MERHSCLCRASNPNPNPTSDSDTESDLNPNPDPNPNPSCSFYPDSNIESDSESDPNPNPNPNPRCSANPNPNLRLELSDGSRRREELSLLDISSAPAARRQGRRESSSDLEKRFWSEGGAEAKAKGITTLTPTATTPLPSSSSSSPTNWAAFRHLQAEPRSESKLELKSEPDPDSESLFSGLPADVLVRIAGPFSWPSLCAASRVCRAWNQNLAPLRKAMFLVYRGKKLKHGRSGTERNLEKALECFLKGAVKGCAAAMVDAGLLLWEMGRREDGMNWYKQAAELGDPAGQYNLGLAYLQEPSNPTEAVRWFHLAALAGHVRAQHSLALCLQQGRGIESSVVKAARWYMRAAEGGSARAMYNVSSCYLKGDGLPRNLREARRWMKNAALAGHRKAQFEHGLTLFAEGDGGLSLVFLELATRAGESAALHLRDALLHQLSPKTRTHALSCADKWEAKQNLRS